MGKLSEKQCCDKETLNKGAWTPEEDESLTKYVKIHGEGKWRSVAKKAGLKRCCKSCRLRWLNYLKPGIKRGQISTDEEDLIIRLHRLLGNRWGRLPGRTDNEIKNYWYRVMAKKLLVKESAGPSLKLHKSEHNKQKRPNKGRVREEVKDTTNTNISQSETSKSPSDESLNFLKDVEIHKMVRQDVFNSDFLQTNTNDETNDESGNIIGEKGNVGPSSSHNCPSQNELVLESETKCEPIQPTLCMELKRVASFLEVEDE